MAYTSLRSTYFHEADSALGFVELNDPNAIRGPEDFKRAASKIGFTFNWFYADHSHIAYFNSGNNPVRAAGTSTHFPVSGEFEWRDWNTDLWTAGYTPPEEHPQVVDQAFLANWNNKQARGYRAADDNFGYGSMYRSDSLSDRIEAGTAGAETMSLVELVDAMEDAGTVDLRATEVLPWALRVLGNDHGRRLRDAIATLNAWVAAGGHRRDRDRNGVYEHSEAIRILDAWWPRWLEAQFQPALGAHPVRRAVGDAAPGQQPERRRRSPWLGLPGRLVRLRPEGPADAARRAGAGPLLARLLRRLTPSRRRRSRAAGRGSRPR